MHRSGKPLLTQDYGVNIQLDLVQYLKRPNSLIRLTIFIYLDKFKERLYLVRYIALALSCRSDQRFNAQFFIRYKKKALPTTFFTSQFLSFVRPYSRWRW